MSVEPRHDGPAGGGAPALAVFYRRAAGLNRETDPRENTLHVDDRWVLTGRRTFGFGRAPAGVDIAVKLVDDSGTQDPAVPRLAGRIAAPDGRWTLTNHATGKTKIYLTAPGLYREIIKDSPGEVLVRTWQMVAIRASGGDIEHRFTLVIGGPGAGAGAVHAANMAGLWETGAPTTSSVGAPAWSHGDRRTLAAYCYPELHGLPPRVRERGAQTLLLLDRELTEASRKWLEKQLGRLRKDASARLGVDLQGERGTPEFIEYILANRGLLMDALRELDSRPTRKLQR
ncbi:hypothetical protein [Frankia sp. CiP1_Cm_nod1]